MDELFEQVFVFIPLALLLFFRFFFESGKRKREQAQAELGTKRPEGIEEFISSLFGGGKRSSAEKPPAISGAELAQASKSISMGEPRAPLQELPRRGTRYAISELDQPLYAPEASAFEGAISLGDLAQSGPNERVQSIGGAKESAARNVLMAERAANPPQAKGGLAGRIDELPPLQKALVMAELLGKPKSLSEQ